MLPLLLFRGFSADITYRICDHENDTVSNCQKRVWSDPMSALIPCNLLSWEFRACSTHGLDKFHGYFPDLPVADLLPSDGCGRDYTDANRFGTAVCRPREGSVCLGEQIWIVQDERCFQEGQIGFISAVCCSFFFGIFGADRYLLGYGLLGTIKLLTLGGLGAWWFVDFILVSLGSLGPRWGAGYHVTY
jgi:TM2 domain-containing membrane protein YozV